jgi:hypothetical protein
MLLRRQVNFKEKRFQETSEKLKIDIFENFLNKINNIYAKKDHKYQFLLNSILVVWEFFSNSSGILLPFPFKRSQLGVVMLFSPII